MGSCAPLPPTVSLSLVSEATIQIRIQENGHSRDAPVGFLVFLLFFLASLFFSNLFV